MSVDEVPENGGEERLDVGEIFRAWIVRLKVYYKGLIVCLFLFFSLSFLVAYLATPSFTAYATVGPPSMSLTSTAMSGMSSLGGLASQQLTGSRLFGSQADPFTQYTELLTSGRLASALAQQKGVLQEVFYERYDSSAKRWRQGNSVLSPIIDGVKTIFHRPIGRTPDANSLQKFLGENLAVSQTLTSPFADVSFTFHDPKQAEELLSRILNTADSLVRMDMMQNVTARLAYLDKLLPQVVQSDQRDALISLVSGQQQLKMTLTADKLFASSLIDPPHAAPNPTSPSIVKFGATAFILGVMSWMALVFFLPADSLILALMASRRSRSETRSPMHRILSSVIRRRGSESW